MTKRTVHKFLFVVGLLLCLYVQTSAKVATISTKPNTSTQTDRKPSNSGETYFDAGALVIDNDTTTVETQSLFPDKSPNLAFSHFTWGAEFGSSIDLTGNNLSTFDLDVNVGYKNSFIKIVGVGVGIHRSIASGDNYIPVYFLFRSSFRKRPSLFFMNLQFGYSFNTISDAPTFGDFSSALGVGLNLTQSRRAKSYVILSVGNRYFNDNHKSLVKLDTKYVYVAKIVIGIHF